MNWGQHGDDWELYDEDGYIVGWIVLGYDRLYRGHNPGHKAMIDTDLDTLKSKVEGRCLRNSL